MLFCEICVQSIPNHLEGRRLSISGHMSSSLASGVFTLGVGGDTLSRDWRRNGNSGLLTIHVPFSGEFS